MRQTAFEALACVLVMLALAVFSNAQITKNPDSVASSSADIYASSLVNDKSSDNQPGGYISGTILDQTGAVRVGASVRLRGQVQSTSQEIQSGDNGQFSFANVTPGPFRLTVTAAGFATREFSATLHSAETYLVPPIMLAVAPAVTEVHVEVTPLTPVEVADLQIKEQEKQRVFGLIPNFYVSYDANALPLNPKQKFRLAWKTTSDPFTYFGVAALAGVEQATNTFDGYGQGAQGYFKRFGASYADVVTGTYIGSAILPVVLKQDPRYFYKGTGSIRSRLLYALASPVICKGDNMRWQPNYSNVAGAFTSASISYLYYPKSDRNGAGLVVQNSLIRLGEIAFEGVLQEFVLRRLTPRLRTRASSGKVPKGNSDCHAPTRESCQVRFAELGR